MKKCKYCKSEIALDAKRCPKCQADLRNWFARHKGLTVAFIIGFGFILLLVQASNNVAERANNAPAEKVVAKDVGVGEEGYLRVSGQNEVFVATSQEALNSFSKSAVAKDTRGMMELLASGGMFEVKSGTKVLVIDFGSIGVKKVRILEGQFENQVGFVPKEFISRQ